jgi:hypothetical protein
VAISEQLLEDIIFKLMKKASDRHTECIGIRRG